MTDAGMIFVFFFCRLTLLNHICNLADWCNFEFHIKKKLNNIVSFLYVDYLHQFGKIILIFSDSASGRLG